MFDSKQGINSEKSFSTSPFHFKYIFLIKYISTYPRIWHVQWYFVKSLWIFQFRRNTKDHYNEKLSNISEIVNDSYCIVF